MTQTGRGEGPATMPQPSAIVVHPVGEAGGRPAGVLSHAIWGLGGFLVGAIFWHWIGFWDFLGSVIDPKRASTSAIARLLREPSSVNGAGSGDSLERRAEAAARNCTTLVLDRASGATRAEPCMLVIRNVPGETEAQARQPLQTAARIDSPAGN